VTFVRFDVTLSVRTNCVGPLPLFIIKLFFLPNKAHVFHICRINNMYVCIEPLHHTLLINPSLRDEVCTTCKSQNWLFVSLNALVLYKYLNWRLLLLKTLCVNNNPFALFNETLCRHFSLISNTYKLWNNFYY
jgi:hypothetical protein